MAHGLNLDVAAGQSSAASIKGIVGEMQGIISTIRGAANSGLSDWQGSASRSFDNVHTDWNATATALQTALDDIEAKLTTGFRGYDDDDAAVATDIVRSGGSSLNV